MHSTTAPDTYAHLRFIRLNPQHHASKPKYDQFGCDTILSMVRVSLLLVLLLFISTSLIARPCGTHGWDLAAIFDPCVESSHKADSSHFGMQPIQVYRPTSLQVIAPLALIWVAQAVGFVTEHRSSPLLPPPRFATPG